MKNRKKYMSDKYLILFFVLTLLWTWICGFIPVIFRFSGTPAGSFLFYFGGGAPSVVALLLIFFTYPKEKRKDYFHRCFSFKYMGWKWPLITICVFSVITIISLFIGVGLLGYDMPKMDFIHAIIDNPLTLLLVLLISLISGPLNEEFGWRGYALDKLLLRFGFLGASTILGFIWGIWHLPWYFTPGQAQYNLLRNSNMLDEEMICRTFDKFCVVCIRNEWISCLREQKRIAESEVNMESAIIKYPERFTSMDTYPSESTIFDVQGIKIAITNDGLAESLNKLSEYGDEEALRAVLANYDGYIRTLATRMVVAEDGCKHYIVDEEIRRGYKEN